MPATRHFLGWDEPVTVKVRRFLIPRAEAGPVDLDGLLIVVPTRQAGRRLRESLALFCAGRGTALLSAEVVPPSVLFRPRAVSPDEAGAAVVKAAWAEVLTRLDPGRCPALFSSRPPERDFAWAMRTGEMIQQLRQTLADGGSRFADVISRCGPDLEEPERWRDLAQVEELYLGRLSKAGLSDPCRLAMDGAEHPGLPDGIREIIVAAVPDPSLLAIRALERLSETVPVRVLVHAPEDLADRFDAWGRPIPEAWAGMPLDVPDSGRNVILAGTPLSQSRRVLMEMSALGPEMGPADVAIGVPDPAVVPVLKEVLGDQGLPAFDPSDCLLREHSLYRLVEAFSRLMTGNGPYDAVRAFVRHPDVLQHLWTRRQLPPSAVLTELDEFQNRFLPFGLEDMARRLIGGRPAGLHPGAAAAAGGGLEGSADREDLPAAGGGGGGRSGGVAAEFPHLASAVVFLRAQVEACGGMPLSGSLRRFLQTIYETRRISSHDARDREFRGAARAMDSVLAEFERAGPELQALDSARAMALLLRRLGEETYHAERELGAIDLEGWLELPWNDAPCLIVSGMNDGIVPASRAADVFLPDSLRTRLGLRNDAARYARDAYLLRSLVESRRDGGRVCLIAGKTTAAGDPLKPSRLLFRCPDAELPALAARLFSPVEEERAGCHASVSFRLNAAPPDAAARGRLRVARLHVTQFRDYLACPFRFYLSHVLKMDPLDDEKQGMDQLDFGTMIHAALERMGREPALWGCDDEGKLAERLAAEVDRWMAASYGRALSLPLLLALDTAKSRLAAAARVQVQLVQAGWEIVQTEKRYEMALGEIRVTGKIDRIDRHRGTGQVRILDYKTSDSALAPAAAHLAPAADDTPEFARLTVEGKARRWVDLQLPLYRMLVAADERFGSEAELGYFNLPKALADTDVAVWDGLAAGTQASARECAAGVVRSIRDRVFWPAAARVRYDDFESLFFGRVEDYAEELSV